MLFATCNKCAEKYQSSVPSCPDRKPTCYLFLLWHKGLCEHHLISITICKRLPSQTHYLFPVFKKDSMMCSKIFGEYSVHLFQKIVLWMPSICKHFKCTAKRTYIEWLIRLWPKVEGDDLYSLCACVLELLDWLGSMFGTWNPVSLYNFFKIISWHFPQ